MSNSEEWDRELLGLLLADHFRDFLKQRGITFLDVVVASSRKRNHIFDEFRSHQPRRKPGRPRVRDIDGIIEFTKKIDEFKLKSRKGGKKWSDDDLLRGIQESASSDSRIRPGTKVALAQTRKTVRNQMSNSRQLSKK